MQTFLGKLAEEIFKDYQDNLSGLAIVFPSRRAGIFFKKELSHLLKNPIWSPDIYSIEDFVQKLSPYTIEDKLILIFELFEVYKTHGEEESFDRFYSWGEMMLRDFDEIDKNLITGSEIFRVIKEIREVEEQFSFLPGDLEQFTEFWRTFSNVELTELQNEFVKTWEILGKVYSDFRKRLDEKKIAYDGMAYRKLYEKIKTKEIELPWEKIIFAGFNLLTKSEEGIIKELINKGIAETYWDADEYYINSPEQEAGNFLRNNFRTLKINKPKWIENNLLSSKKSIKTIGAPLQAGQAKALGNELKKSFSTGDELENTAIVLPDESMLIPVLYSLPEEIESLNVTMGLPMKATPLFNLITLLNNLQANKKTSRESAVFYHKDVIQILMHPYVKFNGPAFIYDSVHDIKRNNIIYVSPSRLMGDDGKHPEILELIFKPVDTSGDVINYLFDILNIISSRLQNSVTSFSKFELEYFYTVYEKLNRLKDIIGAYSGKMETDTLRRLINEVLRSTRIPFTGEPLKGVQIMGLLETRALDFEKIYILSMNESIMPGGVIQNSFIPYSIRKAFKLPTYDEEDAIPAYYLYRLMQRAKNIHLIYNTEVDIFSSGETSRFILQVENELINKNIDYEHKIVTTGISKPFSKEIIVDKTPEVIEKLSNIRFSPSDLNSYINCGLQFYLKKIAGLREEEEIEEFFSPATFGSILHGIMEIVYSPYKSKKITVGIIEELRAKINSNFDSILKQAFESIESLRELDTDLQGKNLLLKNIIKTLVLMILDNDKKDLPFKIVDLERKIDEELEINVNGSAKTVKLSGRIDRIDEREGITTIIDYKTGRAAFQKMGNKTYEEYLDMIFTDPKYKENFQAYFYAYSYLKQDSQKEAKIAIYALRKINEGLNYLTDSAMSRTELDEYGERLNKLIGGILSPEYRFIQTNDIERCRFCAFKSICYRE
jgi:hypothetical protein